jgi:hypothetical protein
MQGLAELSVSDANKQTLTAIPSIINSLRRGLLGGSSGVDATSSLSSSSSSSSSSSTTATAATDETDETVQKLRTLSAATLAQLAASELTLPLLLGHPVLEDLEQVPSLPGSSKDARNDAMAVLFAVRQHEKAEATEAATPGTRTDMMGRRHIMLSYQWDHQPIIKRIRDSLKRAGYRVWLDVDHMRGSTMDAMSDAVDEAAAMCFGVSAAYKESSNCRLVSFWLDILPILPILPAYPPAHLPACSSGRNDDNC